MPWLKATPTRLSLAHSSLAWVLSSFAMHPFKAHAQMVDLCMLSSAESHRLATCVLPICLLYRLCTQCAQVVHLFQVRLQSMWCFGAQFTFSTRTLLTSNRSWQQRYLQIQTSKQRAISMVHPYPFVPDTTQVLEALARQCKEPSIYILMEPGQTDDLQHIANWEDVVKYNQDTSGPSKLHDHHPFLKDDAHLSTLVAAAPCNVRNDWTACCWLS